VLVSPFLQQACLNPGFGWALFTRLLPLLALFHGLPPFAPSLDFFLPCSAWLLFPFCFFYATEAESFFFRAGVVSPPSVDLLVIWGLVPVSPLFRGAARPPGCLFAVLHFPPLFMVPFLGRSRALGLYPGQYPVDFLFFFLFSIVCFP